MNGEKVIECPRCHQNSAEGSSRCSSCGVWLGASDVTLTNAGVETNWSRATRVDSSGLGTGTTLQAGSVIADRYEIQKLLGEGGMGAVYKARDRELDRLVALKVIRSELAGHPAVLQRFKQELILARQVTNRNVIRIFDLGVADGLRFITMEFVDGRDLSSLVEERQTFSPEETVKILRQVCTALEAAHNEGVVHRDLKPQNIMVEANGRVCVMDFGLARSMETSGLTQVGAILGTPAYMAPEQAKGLPADERSDLFSLGIIAYQMLTGTTPFKADTALASMLLRTQGPPPPPIEIVPTLPQGLNDIVMKMLATAPESRYQKAAELNKDLEDWQEGVLARQIVTPRMAMMAPSETKKWVAWSVAGAVVLGGCIWGVVTLLQKPVAPPSPTTVIIADFNNHTGDSVFSGTMESTLKLALEGASFISAYDRTRMRELGVPPVSGALDEVKAQAIAASQGLNMVVTGSLDRKGAEYQLSVRAIQTVTGKVVAQRDETAASKDQVLFAVTKLGTAVRKALGDSTTESAQRLSMETLSASSLEAVHEYAAGLDMLSAGKFADAQQHLSKAVDLDPNFGMAYTIMASASRNLGHFKEAKEYMKEGLKHIDRMTERERYRTRAYTYLLSGDHQKCVDEYSALLEKYPADTGAYTNVAVCLVHLHNVAKAEVYARRAVAILPKRAIYHANLAGSLVYAGNFPAAEKEAAEAAKLGYVNGYLLEAWASLGQEQIDQATEAYRNLEKRLPSDAATGFADLAMYQGRYSEAAAMLEKGAVADSSGRAPDADAASTKYWMLARVQLMRGQKAAALAAAEKATNLSQAFQTRYVVGEVYAQLGEAVKAREISTSLASETQVEPQVYGKLIDGEIALNAGDHSAAIQRFTEANNILDTWLGRFGLGRAYLAAQKFVEADSEFDRCMRRRGEALFLFLDLSTYSYFPPVYYYQGQAREGMKTSGFAESYRKYLEIRGKGGEDPLASEAKRRAGL
jgi:tetratricopeptide (TPR) repeat protein/predicted Ser/Thr protein kinase